MCVRAHAWHVKRHRVQADSKLCTHPRRWRCREEGEEREFCNNSVCAAAVADLSLLSSPLSASPSSSLFLSVCLTHSHSLSISLSLTHTLSVLSFRLSYVLLFNMHICGLSQEAIRQRTARQQASSTPRWYGTPRPTRTRGRMRRAV
jgi:hypothetical protein